jgi:TrmH family RNA methyltransferase
MIHKITSLRNPLVKNVLLLQEKARERTAQGLFVIEGFREIRLAVSSGFHLVSCFYCPEIVKSARDRESLLSQKDVEILEVSRPVYNRMAYRKDAEGILALAKPGINDFSSLHLSERPLILVLESVEKPGNLGAILRTADAANVDAVIICDPQTDLFNPNTIRSSIGCIFTVPVIVSTGTETLLWLKEKGISSYATALTAETFYHTCDYGFGIHRAK